MSILFESVVWIVGIQIFSVVDAGVVGSSISEYDACVFLHKIINEVLNN